MRIAEMKGRFENLNAFGFMGNSKRQRVPLPFWNGPKRSIGEEHYILWEINMYYLSDNVRNIKTNLYFQIHPNNQCCCQKSQKQNTQKEITVLIEQYQR
jgi:hypothetical protein